jgi:hypothetical protein
LVEIRQSLKDLFGEHKLRGASTISMQTARTIYLLPDRGIMRKGLEAYYTLLIELIWDKRRILEIYLNTVDWGSGIMGAEAASLKYFQKHSNQLTPHQAARLAAILPNPPFFAMRLWPKIHYNMGGVQIDTQARIIGLDRQPIKGFYAAGQVTGGIHGACRLGGLRHHGPLSEPELSF